MDASPEEGVRWNLLFVVHILIEDEHIRIISARKATRSERVIYEI